jgi:hypothetical protein
LHRLRKCATGEGEGECYFEWKMGPHNSSIDLNVYRQAWAAFHQWLIDTPVPPPLTRPPSAGRAGATTTATAAPQTTAGVAGPPKVGATGVSGEKKEEKR